MAEFKCSMCFYVSDSHDKLIAHIVKRHKHDSTFVVHCNVQGCSYNSKSWNGYKSHVSRKHRFAVVDHDHIDQLSDVEVEIPDAPLLESDKKKLLNGTFTLSLEARSGLTQTAIDNVVDSANVLVHEHVQAFRQKAKDALLDRGLPCDFLDDIPLDTFLDDLSNNVKREHVYTNHFGYIKPQPVALGKNYVTKAGVLKEVTLYGYIIPFMANIKSLLELPEIWHSINNPHTSTSNFMFDICDGQYIKNSDFFQRNPKALQFILTTDDIEIVNPIGSHTKKHKLTMFYYSIANIPPMYRSVLHSIQLLGVAKTSHLRSSTAEPLLEDFIDTVNKMSSDGIELNIHGNEVNIKGALVISPCDTPAANWLAGFKEGVGFAFKSCRICNITSDESKQSFLPNLFPLRTCEEHLERLNSLENENLSQDAKKYWSKLWGINSRSCLTKLNNFNFCQGLVQDPMHIFMEGLIPYEMKLMLFDFIYVQRYFSLKWLNARITSFSYSYLERKSKPEAINKNAFSVRGSIKQTSAAMYQLCIILPFLVDVRIPRNNSQWTNFLRLVQSMLFATSPFCSVTTPALLEQLLYDHHTEFVRLYPKASITPKMHYALHLPLQMIMFGPLRHQWCMRFEAKHGFFKRKQWKCFKNLPLSVAVTHQKHQCYKQMGPLGTKNVSYLSQGDAITEGSMVDLFQMYHDLEDVIGGYFHILPEHGCPVYTTDNIVINGLNYRPGCFIVLDYIDNVPYFAEVKCIFVKDDKKIFIVQKVLVQYFDAHLLSYVCDMTEEKTLVKVSRLSFKWPLSMHYHNGSMCITNKYTHTAELLL